LEAAAKHKIPAIYPEVAFVSDGGLMSYAAGRAIYRKVAVDYVGKILAEPILQICLFSGLPHSSSSST
jgi:hypothetical protein